MLFAPEQCRHVGQCIGDALASRCNLTLFAMAVQSWHVHFVTSVPAVAVSQVAKCAKDAARWGLQIDRPIWGTGYDKRYCYDVEAVKNRILYVERHNLAAGQPPKPWAFIRPLVV